MKNAVIIMTKVPAAGNVKTRLQPTLSAEQCAALAVCFLRDAVGKVNSSETPLIVAFSPPTERKALLKILPDESNLIEQTGSTLGEKMFNAFQSAFSQNFDLIVMIGTDSPTLPPEFITQAFELLSESDAVLGAATDGGFYLIGLRVIYKEIFEAVEWSSPQTFEQTKSNIEKLNLKLSFLPEWFGVDTPDDFERLRNDLTNDSNIAPHTFSFVKNFYE